MKHFVKVAAIMLYAFLLSGCQKAPVLAVAERSDVALQTNDRIPDDKIPHDKILVDASRDGGAWWYPQEQSTGFSSGAYHQGQPLADYLRSLGYEVDELPRGSTITDDVLNQYNKVIRASGYGTYTSLEIIAYDHFVNRNSSLLLLQDHLLHYDDDNLSEHLGVKFAGGTDGGMMVAQSNSITSGIESMYYPFGSVVINATGNSSMTVLGSLEGNVAYHPFKTGSDNGTIVSPAVMGTLNSYPSCKIFFMGDVNGLESIPQPLVDNLIQWAFK